MHYINYNAKREKVNSLINPDKISINIYKDAPWRLLEEAVGEDE
jgi:hypothetical protein